MDTLIIVKDPNGEVVGVQVNGKLLMFGEQQVTEFEAARIKHEYKNGMVNSLFRTELKVQLMSNGEINGSQG